MRCVDRRCLFPACVFSVEDESELFPRLRSRDSDAVCSDAPTPASTPTVSSVPDTVPKSRFWVVAQLHPHLVVAKLCARIDVRIVRWRVAVIQMRSPGAATPKAPPKPFAGLRAKEFLTLVREKEAAISKGLPDVLRAVRRSVAAKVVLIGFTDIHQLAGTHEDDVTDFFPSPVHRAVFLQFVQYVECTKAVKRKREEQVLKTLVSSGA